MEDSLQQAQKSAAVWKQRYEKIYDKYQELKKEVQPYLDAVKLAPEKVRAFLDAILDTNPANKGARINLPAASRTKWNFN